MENINLKENCKYPNIVKVLKIKECADCLYETFCLKDLVKEKENMNKYRYWIESWKECRYNLAIKSCAECLFQNLCLFEQNQERLWKDTHETEKTL